MNPHRVEKGITHLSVDGCDVEGTIIPYVSGKPEYHVEVTMG